MTAADDLQFRLALYRAVRQGAAWLRQRLEDDRDRQFWPGAPERPRRDDPQLRLPQR